MRQDHYLNLAYTARQMQNFERERIAVTCLCFTESRSIPELAETLGIYQAKRVVEELLKDGYLTRVRDAKTAEIRYKTNIQAIGPRAFFLG